MQVFKNRVAITHSILIRSDNNTELHFEGSKLKVEKVTYENLNDAARFNSGEELVEFKNFLDKGYKGYYCYYDNICIHRVWLFTDSARTIVSDGFLYNLNNNEYWIAWVETDRYYRGMGAFLTSLQFILKDNPNKIILGTVNPKNSISLKVFTKCGFYEFKKYIFIKISRFKMIVQYRRYNKVSFNVKFGSNV